MKIHSIKIINYRCFDEINLEFDAKYNLHIIIAPNMLGKSALLRAITIATSTYLRKIDRNGYKTINRGEHRVIGNNPFTDTARECSIETEAGITVFNGSDGWKDEIFKWRLFREEWSRVNQKLAMISDNEIEKSIKNTYDRVIEKKENSLPVFLYVGTEYIHQPHAITDTLKLDGSAIQGYWYWHEEKSMEKYVFDWLEVMYRTKREQEQSKNGEIFYGNLPDLCLNNFKNVIKKMFLEEIEEVAWVENTRNIKKEKQNGSVTNYFLTFRFKNQEVRTFEMLSDGYRYLILLCGELIVRCCLLNKHLKEKDISLQTTGVVIIDEFGIHLHPELQMLAIKRLVEIFPKIQFILSTHSPLLLNGLNKEQIHIIESDDNGKRTIRNADDNIVGYGAEGILTKLFGLTSTFDDESKKWGNDYSKLFYKKHISKEELTPQELETISNLDKKLSSINVGSLVNIPEDPLYTKYKERLKKFEEQKSTKNNKN